MTSNPASLRIAHSYPEHALPPNVQKLTRPPALLKATSLSFLIFEKPDLEQTKDFLIDFGMSCVSHTQTRLVMRGTGTAPCIYFARKGEASRYCGAAFNVANIDELVRLEQQTGARRLSSDEFPGGGTAVELIDPAGNLVWLIADQPSLEAKPLRAPLHPTTNGPGLTRRINATVRPPLEPAAISRLGHVVIQTVDFEIMSQWYMHHLGIIPTDVQYLNDGSPALCFFRLDLGDKPADHHSLVLVGGLEEKYEHSAYEVLDLDALGQGQNFLRAHGHRHMWGIGRHILGSQLFDYWFDPDGMEFEHYTDGDVFTADHETHYVPLDMAGIWAWGDDVPKSMGPQKNLRTLGKILGLLLRRRISLQRLKLLGQAMSAPARPWL